jgi:hypothetical protein
MFIWNYVKSMKRKMSRATDSIRVRGCVKSGKIILEIAQRRHPALFLRRWREQRFDRKHNTHTSGFISLEAHCVVNYADGHNYVGTPVSIFEEAMAKLALDFSQFHFVDYGSGMGKALMLAARYPFRCVTGVEWSEALHKIAKTNIGMWRLADQRCFNVRSVCADASCWSPPDEPCVLYFFNPFRPPLLARVLDNILQSAALAPRLIYIVYLLPSYPEVFNQFPELECKVDAIMHDRLYTIYQVRKRS